MFKPCLNLLGRYVDCVFILHHDRVHDDSTHSQVRRVGPNSEIVYTFSSSTKFNLFRKSNFRLNTCLIMLKLFFE
jgi:hypothetical protein